MNQHAQRQPSAPAARPAASTPLEARKLAQDMVEVMSALLAVVERETELVRAGKVAEAMRLEGQKGALSRRYVIAAENLKAAQKHLARDRACGIGRHRARRQRRGAAPQYSQHLHRCRTARRAKPAPDQAARGQPLALRNPGSLNFSANSRAAVSAGFNTFSNGLLRGGR